MIPDKHALFPNPNIPSLCLIQNAVTRENIQVGDYTYYDDPDGAARFEERVTHHYAFLGDRLIIGKFCSIGKGIEFIMNGANHRMGSVSTYPFNLLGGDWESSVPALDDLPLKGDTVVGSDVWIGQNVTVLPGVHIGDGAIIGANAVVAKDIPPYTIAAGNPAEVIRRRFSEEIIEHLLALRWWDRDIQWITQNLPVLCSGNPEEILTIQ